MSLIHWTSLSQVVGEKVVPIARERFSRQLVPDRASCSLSDRRGGGERGREKEKERERRGRDRGRGGVRERERR